MPRPRGPNRRESRGFFALVRFRVWTAWLAFRLKPGGALFAREFHLDGDVLELMRSQ
jgi:hypothetical protein